MLAEVMEEESLNLERVDSEPAGMEVGDERSPPPGAQAQLRSAVVVAPRASQSASAKSDGREGEVGSPAREGRRGRSPPSQHRSRIF